MEARAVSSVRASAPWRLTVFSMLTLLAAAGIVFSLVSGAVHVGLGDIYRVFTGDMQGNIHAIIWNVRLPRTLIAALVGVNLSLAGALLQGVMRNSMADPHIIGVSSGAGMFGIATLVMFPAYAYLMTPVAFVGALVATMIIYALAWQNGVSPGRIILAGVAVSAFFSSGISGMLVFYSDRVDGALLFLVGGLSAKSWPHLHLLLPYTIVGVLFALLAAQRMNILMLGDSDAKGLGLNVELIRFGVTAAAALLSASAVSVVGLLAFVGLVVPHAARLLIGNDYRLLIPAAMLLGIAAITIFDTVARIVFAPVELPVGIIMGAVGAPFFLYLLRKRGNHV
ncbi:iron complex transport system permease protein [Paenibacillus sp. UNCCL117]|uniref:FecCD family ABC transporter permease n=1 Tax=unclassified Paenibacillus TaxID=185978 RepID=UPI00087E07A9|nr:MULTISPECIES: iron ABC transporter permease [unclassified Paenibacillus]SDE41621.1 iron complex transport system permease protein [Paenibacillus sp. cl123]SFW65516.1 iron complex transport system permease protein [Paenibacillus sp. UNCCL117]